MHLVGSGDPGLPYLCWNWEGDAETSWTAKTRWEDAATGLLLRTQLHNQQPQRFPLPSPYISPVPPPPVALPSWSPTSHPIGSPRHRQRGASRVVCPVISRRFREGPPPCGMGMSPNYMASYYCRTALDYSWEALKPLSGALSGTLEELIASCMVGRKHWGLRHCSQGGFWHGGSGGGWEGGPWGSHTFLKKFFVYCRVIWQIKFHPHRKQIRNVHPKRSPGAMKQRHVTSHSVP